MTIAQKIAKRLKEFAEDLERGDISKYRVVHVCKVPGCEYRKMLKWGERRKQR